MRPGDQVRVSVDGLGEYVQDQLRTEIALAQEQGILIGTFLGLAVWQPGNYAVLVGLPKTAWKHGIMNNSSNDGRELISNKLSEWKHPLDTRKKEMGRIGKQKWWSGTPWK